MFTANNCFMEDDDDVYRGLMDMYNDKIFTHLIIGQEFAPTTTTPHLQGAAILDKKMVRSALQAAFDSYCNNKKFFWEKMWGDAAESRDYCSKGNDYIMLGDWSGFQTRGEAGREGGKRHYNGIEEAMKNCSRAKDFVDWLFENLQPMDVTKNLDRYLKSWAKIRSMYAKPGRLYWPGDENAPENAEFLECEWIMGPSGAGKSHMAREENEDHYEKMPDGKWMDDYDFQSCVIIDDLDRSNVIHVRESIKNLADVYPVRVQVKGASMLIRPTKIVITSQYSIDHVFSGDAAMQIALARRFTVRRIPPRETAAPRVSDSDDEDVVLVADTGAAADPEGAVPMPAAAFW